MQMKTTTTLFALAIVFSASAQESGFQLALDPPGNNTFLTYCDAAVYADGSTVMMAIASPYLIAPGAAVVTRLDANGGIQWSRHLGPTGTLASFTPKRIVAMPDGGAAVFGNMNDGAYEYYFVTRLDPSGSLAWSKLFSPEVIGGWPDYDYGYGTAHAMPDGGLMLNLGLTTTPTFVRLAANGSITWARSYVTDDPDTTKSPTFDFDITDNGGVLITEKANSDMMLIMTDASGQVLWSHRYNANFNYTHCKTAKELANGDLLTAGYSGSLPFAARFTSNGTLIWMRNYDLQLNYDGFQRIMELSSGDILLSSRATGYGGGVAVGTEVSLRINSTGSPLGLFNVVGDLTQPSLEVIGEVNGMFYIGGQGIAQVDGGYDNFHLLCKVDGQFSDACGLEPGTGIIGSTSVGSSVTVTDGCSNHDRNVSSTAFAVDVTNAIYTSRDLCFLLTSVPENGNASSVNVYPSPVIGGEAINVAINDKSATRIEVIATDGRIVQAVAVNDHENIDLNTTGMNAGLYLVRVLDAHGARLHEARVVVE